MQIKELDSILLYYSWIFWDLHVSRMEHHGFWTVQSKTCLWFLLTMALMCGLLILEEQNIATNILP